jgi:hypothetical protein
MTTDANGNVLLPNWFLRFLSVIVMLLTICVIPWAATVMRDLSTLASGVTGLRLQIDSQATLQDEVVRNINDRITRIELKLHRREQRRPAGGY